VLCGGFETPTPTTASNPFRVAAVRRTPTRLESAARRGMDVFGRFRLVSCSRLSLGCSLGSASVSRACRLGQPGRLLLALAPAGPQPHRRPHGRDGPTSTHTRSVRVPCDRVPEIEPLSN
jgi:hypothetical protein